MNTERMVLNQIGYGNANGNLTSAEVLAIFRQAKTESVTAVAQRYGVYESTVRKITSGEIWGWLTRKPLTSPAADYEALCITEYYQGAS